jgi:pimeloyl-ACP methyl ester carboxylesterase
MSGRSFLLDVAGGRRRIRVFEAGDGPPLVFLHGAGGLATPSSADRIGRFGITTR